MEHFISVHDAGNIDALLEKALAYKSEPLKDKALGLGKRVGLLFFNPSLRTRLSTQIAAQNLGMEPVVLNVGSEGWALEFSDGAIMDGKTVEHVKDAARVLGSYFDILCVRTFPGLVDRAEDYGEHVLRQIVKYGGVPVVSMESATLHPLQSLADTLTIATNGIARLRPRVVLTWAPHIKAIPQCVGNSFAQWMCAWGHADLTVVQPEGLELDKAFTSGAKILYDQDEAIRDADFIYVKNWSAYEDYGTVKQDGRDWMLTEQKLKGSAARVMHCLPVRRNVELSDELLDGPRSLVGQQAQNRIWAAQAVFAEILKGI